MHPTERFTNGFGIKKLSSYRVPETKLQTETIKDRIGVLKIQKIFVIPFRMRPEVVDLPELRQSFICRISGTGNSDM
jgi:hypothetical protein